MKSLHGQVPIRADDTRRRHHHRSIDPPLGRRWRRFLPVGIFLTLLLVSVMPAMAQTYTLPPGKTDLIGLQREVEATHLDTLVDVARRHGIGYVEMKRANPGIDPWMPGATTRLVVPGRHILPRAPRRGIVVNLPEMRIYRFFEPYPTGAQRVDSYPVSIGRMDWSTPLGQTRIVAKQENPAWHPPESIRKEHEEAGDPLPARVPPGPDNPLGTHAMRLAIPGYLVHGTNKPFGIGMQVTHGCIRMYPEDIAKLFRETEVGTDVHIVNQPIKVGWAHGTLYLESHPPLNDGPPNGESPMAMAMRLISLATNDRPPEGLDWQAVQRIVEAAQGIPQPIWDAYRNDQPVHQASEQRPEATPDKPLRRLPAGSVHPPPNPSGDEV